MRIALHWYRRDLRIADNTALHQALADHDLVWPVFVFDPVILAREDTGAARVAFLLDALDSLRRNIEAAGGHLILRRGKPEEELLRLAKETGATALTFNRDYEPYARRRDAAVTQALEAAGVAVRSYKDDVLQEPGDVLKADGQPYRVFTPYAKAWRAKPVSAVLPKAKFPPNPNRKIPPSEDLPTLAALGFSTQAELPRGGERAARERLAAFLDGPILAYQSRRDFPAVEGTSRLSADLRFGTLSARTVHAAAAEKAARARKNTDEVETYITELIWREFYRQILWHFPHVETSAFKEETDAIAWENDERLFAAWCEGRTGYPLVDAAMRQLNATGWMHNRLRMVAAMFLTKDLLIDWRWGERYFMQRLVDGDLASNNGGWQWSASTGTDAAPYFRIFNPNSQARRYDPEGRFIAQWVPEAEEGRPGAYPRPIVDHNQRRARAIALFRDTGG